MGGAEVGGEEPEGCHSVTHVSAPAVVACIREEEARGRSPHHGLAVVLLERRQPEVDLAQRLRGEGHTLAAGYS
jgi:hypothetical protein